MRRRPGPEFQLRSLGAPPSGRTRRADPGRPRPSARTLTASSRPCSSNASTSAPAARRPMARPAQLARSLARRPRGAALSPARRVFGTALAARHPHPCLPRLPAPPPGKAPPRPAPPRGVRPLPQAAAPPAGAERAARLTGPLSGPPAPSPRAAPPPGSPPNPAWSVRWDGRRGPAVLPRGSRTPPRTPGPLSPCHTPSQSTNVTPRTDTPEDPPEHHALPHASFTHRALTSSFHTRTWARPQTPWAHQSTSTLTPLGH